MKLVLRGHHLLCLKGFQGYGYDENFVENMAKVNSLKNLDSTTISLTNQADDLCKSCPNLKNNLCKNQERNEIIRKMDDEVLKKIDSSKEHNSVELFKKIDEIFNNEESVSKICFNCMWHEKCLFYQKLLNNR
ncbi:DUF1284 domain-containing protein [Methanobrevibacter sp.]|uniref:DUF1284 domain-containing protein n=1 Tax=Methanobrevibacter sp. TaxID=66852 RepID=UPI0025F6FA07|nr:DUF1284 domain-containing protein [Methanobrevibacter sp.]MBR4448173.1 DUF1284 domain-containing protein [Methanobrevibacter sp.]